MKKLAAISFIAVLLFNFCGYRMLIDYMANRQTAAAQSKADNDQYNNDELITVKTALNLPYYSSSSNSEQFEKAYGSAEVNGVVYHYVKRRVYNDTLELLCLPDQSKQHLQTAKNDFFKMSLDGAPSQNHKAPGIIKISLPDYCQEIAWPSLQVISSIRTKYFSLDVQLPATGYTFKNEQPPEMLA